MEELGRTTFFLENQRTYFLKSAVLERLPTCFSTSFEANLNKLDGFATCCLKFDDFSGVLTMLEDI